MDGTFVTAIEAKARIPQVVEVDGDERLIVPNDWTYKTPAAPTAAPLLFHTLSGLRDWIEKGTDKIETELPMLHVSNFGEVQVIAALGDIHAKHGRALWAKAQAFPIGFKFGEWYDAESFMIALQSQFAETVTRNSLVVLVGSIRESDVKELVDDSVSQEVKTARGIHLLGSEKVPNPVRLTPYRTFREVAQPESEFVLRLRSGGPGGKPSFALFEADGATWKLAAMSAVGAWLREALPEAIVMA